MNLEFPNGLKLTKALIEEVDISDEIKNGRQAVTVAYKPSPNRTYLHFSLTPEQVNQFMESQCQS